MNKLHMKKNVLSCLCALATGASFAVPTLTDYYWASNTVGKSVSGSFGDVRNWWSDADGTAAAALPGTCSRARFWFAGPALADGGYTVTLPTLQTKATISIHARENIPITFDGSGNEFQALSTEADNYGEHIISIYGIQYPPNEGFEQAYFLNQSCRGGYKLTDAVLEVTPYWINNGSLDAVVFKRGTFNFYDPEGIPLDTTFVIAGGNDDKEAKYVFEPDSELRIKSITFAKTGQTRRQTLRFNGNTHHVFGDLHIARNNGDGRISSVHVDGDYTTLYAGRFRMSNENPQSAAGYNGTHQLFVENGGALVSSNGVDIAAYGTQLVAITNGANVTFGTTATLPLNQIWGADDYGWHSYSTNTVLVRGATLTMIGTNEFSNTHLVLDDATANFGNSFSFGKKYDGCTYLAATNSTINFGSVSPDFGCGYGQRVTVDLYNTKVNGTGGKLRFGQYSGGHGYRLNASCDMTIDGAESAISLNAERNGSCIELGSNGSGVLCMKDGNISAYQFLMASSTYCVTSVLHQTGGRITVTGGKYAANETQWYGFNVYDSGNSTCRAYCHVILDGGEICAHRFKASNSRTFTGRSGYSRLDANGGAIVGIQAASAENNITVAGFDEANLGEKGLTIRSDYETRTAQDFRDMEGHEGRGLLRLEGSGVKKLSGTNSVESVLVCAGGKTLFVPNTTTGANASHYANVIVTNSAVLSLAGDQTTATFRSLTLARGADLEMEKADLITVDGLVTVGENLVLDITDGASVGSYPLIVCNGEVSPESVLNWRRAVVTIPGRTNLGVTPVATYDELTGWTTFSLEITEGGPLTGDVTWNGTWNGVTGADCVTFSGGGMAAAAVDADVIVGALAFDSSVDYTLSGNGNLAFSDRGGYARVDVTRGEQTISAEIEAPSDLTLVTASGAKLTVDGEIVVGGIIKEGRGTVSVENAANGLSAGVTVKEGLLSATTPDALGKGPISLKGGTLEIKGAGVVDAPSVSLATAYAATAAIVKVEADVSMPPIEATQGAFIKRGAGRLTFASGRSMTVCGLNSGTLAAENDKRVMSTTTFDAEGNYAVDGKYAFGGFNVAEGELVLRGTASDVVFAAPAYVCVGIGTSQGLASPGLVVDHATLACSGSRFLFGTTYNSSFAAEPYLIVTNKSTLTGTFSCGQDASTANLSARVLFDDSVQFSGYRFYPMRGSKHAEYVYRNGSALYVNKGGTDAPTKAYDGVVFNDGTATLMFSNSVLARKTAIASDVILPVTIAGESSGKAHDVRMRDGSTLYSNWVTNKYSASAAMLTVGFDNSEWKPIRSDETGDFTFDFPPYESVRFEMEGRGVILSPSEGRTFTVVSPFVGEGGLRKQGSGTLAFASKDGMKSWGFAGTMSLEGGTVTLAEGAARAGAKVDIAPDATLVLNGTTLEGAVVSGGGTVSNGTLDSSRIMVDVTDAGEVSSSVKFSNVAFAGRTIIDFGRTEETPVPNHTMTVALFSYAGNAPDVSGWQARGLGRENVIGSFDAANGVVTCTISRTGLVLIVR